MRNFLMVTAWLGLCLPGIAAAEDTSIRAIPLPDHRTLEITTPVSWHMDVQQQPDRPPTIGFRSEGDAQYEIYIETRWLAVGTTTAIELASKKIRVQSAADYKAPRTIEKTVLVKPLEGDELRGYYYSMTDSDSVPVAEREGYKSLSQGFILVGDFEADFVIMSNDSSGETARLVLLAIQSMAIRNPLVASPSKAL